MKKKNSFIFYLDYWQFFKLLDDSDLASLMRAVFEYEKEGTEPSGMSEKAQIAFAMVKENLDRDREKYSDACKRNQQIAKARWQKIKDKRPEDVDDFDIYATRYRSLPLDTKNTDNDNDNDSDIDNESDSDKKNLTRKSKTVYTV